MSNTWFAFFKRQKNIIKFHYKQVSTCIYPKASKVINDLANKTKLSQSKSKIINLILLISAALIFTDLVLSIYHNSIFKYSRDNVNIYINFDINNKWIVDETHAQMELDPMTVKTTLTKKHEIKELSDMFRLLPGNIDLSPPKLSILSFPKELNICWNQAAINYFLQNQDITLQDLKSNINRIKILQLARNSELGSFEMEMNYFKNEYIFPDNYKLDEREFYSNKVIWIVYPVHCNQPTDPNHNADMIYNFINFDWGIQRADILKKLQEIEDNYQVIQTSE
jgi:hypothetical protein